MPTEQEWLAVDENRLDFSQLMHYIDLDVVSAGMPAEQMREVRFGDSSEDEKWAMFEPHWRCARNTTFAWVVEESVREFYGVDGLNSGTYKEVGRRIRETRRPGRYRQILKDAAHIAVSLLDTGCTDPDPELFAPVLRLDQFVSLAGRRGLEDLERSLSASLTTLADLERAQSEAVRAARRDGMVAIKSAQAYLRPLSYLHVSRGSASAAFDRVASSAGADAAFDDFKALSDYMFHHMVAECIDCDLPIQIHTGMAASTAARVSPTNPALLVDVFLRYPEAKFDLFHAGFPYWEEMGVLVKTFPNIRADLCWTHIISPSASRRALDEWLELVPANKIFAFGGDLGSVEIAAIHCRLARANVAEVLANKVDRGFLTLTEAKQVADAILRDNAIQFFGLEPRC